MAQLAILKAVEVIGEAASHFSTSWEETHPETPWRKIAGMRNRLAHEYFDVSLEGV